MPTDTERLDFLQQLTNEARYTGKVILRLSFTGRGWRLHESGKPDAVSDVREAIDNFMEALEGASTAGARQSRPPELEAIIKFLGEMIEKDMIPEKKKSELFFNLLKDAYKYISADGVIKMLTNEPITRYAWTAAGARRPRPPC